MTTRVESQRGLLQVMLAAVLWGTVGVTTKSLYAISGANPLSIGFFRLAFSVPVLALACWLMLRRRAFAVRRRDLGLMMLMGAMLALYQVCYFGAIQRIGVSVAVLITLCTAPVIVALLSAVFLRERLTWLVLAALASALVGTVLLIDLHPGGGMEDSSTLIGVLLAFISATGYALIALLSRALAGRYHPLQSMSIGFAVGAVMLLLIALPTGFVVGYPADAWLHLLYLGVVPTALAYFVFFAGMRHTPATVASIATLIEPLTGTILAALLFGERLGRTGWLGALLLIGAMLMLWRNGR
jgi:DME family drug/metabolite transporter